MTLSPHLPWLLWNYGAQASGHYQPYDVVRCDLCHRLTREPLWYDQGLGRPWGRSAVCVLSVAMTGLTSGSPGPQLEKLRLRGGLREQPWVQGAALLRVPVLPGLLCRAERT